jgi:hypothetical protein
VSRCWGAGVGCGLQASNKGCANAYAVLVIGTQTPDGTAAAWSCGSGVLMGCICVRVSGEGTKPPGLLEWCGVWLWGWVALGDSCNWTSSIS